MNKDKALEELFLAQKPHFDDNDAFMQQFLKRMDSVEYIKQHQDATLRRYKLAIVTAFAVGIVSGIVTMLFILSKPTDMPLFTFHVQTGSLLWIAENSRLIVATALALLLSLGIISIISNIQDIFNMHNHMKLHSSKPTITL